MMIFHFEFVTIFTLHNLQNKLFSLIDMNADGVDGFMMTAQSIILKIQFKEYHCLYTE